MHAALPAARRSHACLPSGHGWLVWNRSGPVRCAILISVPISRYLPLTPSNHFHHVSCSPAPSRTLGRGFLRGACPLPSTVEQEKHGGCGVERKSIPTVPLYTLPIPALFWTPTSSLSSCRGLGE